jgi:CheY-like chemotaxis protein
MTFMSQSSVLLIEPDDDSRDMYQEYLRARGIVVVVADTTDEGLVRAADAGVIVTGIRVPGSFDGIELVRRLRRSPRTRGVAIIVLTACALEPDERRAFAAGCDSFLPKPCLPQTLEKEIRRFQALHRLPGAAAVKANPASRPRKRRES